MLTGILRLTGKLRLARILRLTLILLLTGKLLLRRVSLPRLRRIGQLAGCWKWLSRNRLPRHCLLSGDRLTGIARLTRVRLRERIGLTWDGLSRNLLSRHRLTGVLLRERLSRLPGILRLSSGGLARVLLLPRDLLAGILLLPGVLLLARVLRLLPAGLTGILLLLYRIDAGGKLSAGSTHLRKLGGHGIAGTLCLCQIQLAGRGVCSVIGIRGAVRSGLILIILAAQRVGRFLDERIGQGSISRHVNHAPVVFAG